MSVDDELSARAMLADVTAGQPAAPPDRYGSVRRRAVVHRRRQYAAIAAVIAVLAVAAVTIPLRLLGTAPPTTPTSYHLSEQPPGPGDHGGLVAAGVLDGQRWALTVTHESGSVPGVCTRWSPGSGLSCGEGPPPRASATGAPAESDSDGQWGSGYLDVATVRSDVTSLQVSYTNGQVITLHPVAVFAGPYARYVVIAAPSAGSVVAVTAFAGPRDLGYAVPFGAPDELDLVRWLRPGQAALPPPVTRVVGSGSAGGSSWNVKVAIGPWGTCVYASSGQSVCGASTDSKLPAGTVVSPDGGMAILGENVQVYSGQAAAQVSYLTVATKDGTTSRVPVVSVGSLRFYACADVRGDRIVRWAAYDAAGHLLVRSRPGQVP